MTMIAYAFLQHRRLAAAKREKKNQRAAASPQLACGAKCYRQPHHATAAAMPPLPEIDRPSAA